MLNLLVKHWRSTNDGVMGGVSSGQVVESALGLIFKGDLSLENSGGFSSVNRLVTEDLSQSIGIRVRVKGDGRTYQFSARRSVERGRDCEVKLMAAIIQVACRRPHGGHLH